MRPPLPRLPCTTAVGGGRRPRTGGGAYNRYHGNARAGGTRERAGGGAVTAATVGWGGRRLLTSGGRGTGGRPGSLLRWVVARSLDEPDDRALRRRRTSSGRHPRGHDHVGVAWRSSARPSCGGGWGLVCGAGTYTVYFEGLTFFFTAETKKKCF